MLLDKVIVAYGDGSVWGHLYSIFDLVSTGKTEEAGEEMEYHLKRSLQNSLKTFQVTDPPSDSAQ